MIRLKRKKYWFTLLETILVCSAFALLITWIILAINRAFTFINNTRLAVRATNFAREWVEMMYNIRDTNRRKYSWERDAYRLNVWSWNNNFHQWLYVLSVEWTGSFVYATYLGLSSSCNDIDKFYSDDGFWWDDCKTNRNRAILDFSWSTYNYYSWGIQTWNMQDLLIWDWLEFYRIVRVFGIYKKDEDATNTLASNSQLTDWTPAEMRFCVKVFYRWNWQHSSELCSIMTNFEE